MRFSAASATLLSLPLLASADSADYQAQFQNYLEKAWSYIPSPSSGDPIGAAQAKAGSLKLDIVTLSNWQDVLYSHVKPGSTTPEDTWLFITGGKKTCFDRCEVLEAAFNQTAAKLALQPKGPHTALLNCEQEPVLCNSWSAPPGALWIFEMLPRPAPINIWAKRFNHTSGTSEDFLKLQNGAYKESANLHDGHFHPFNGFLAQNGLGFIVGYILWGFNAVPSWLFMIGISMASRAFMGNRMGGQAAGRPRTAPAGPPPAARPAGGRAAL